MRSNKEVMEAITVYFAKKDVENCYRIYLVQDNYSHSVGTIQKSLSYAEKELGLSVPDTEEINIEVLRGERYNMVMSIEFDSKTPPIKQGFQLTKNSAIWEWLKY